MSEVCSSEILGNHAQIITHGLIFIIKIESLSVMEEWKYH